MQDTCGETPNQDSWNIRDVGQVVFQQPEIQIPLPKLSHLAKGTVWQRDVGAHVLRELSPCGRNKRSMENRIYLAQGASRGVGSGGWVGKNQGQVKIRTWVSRKTWTWIN